MNRLTDDRFASEGFYQPKSREERLEIFKNIPSLEAIYKKLAEYEQIGWSPTKIKELIDWSNSLNIKEMYENERIAQQYKWISVKERMPEERDWYLGIFEDEFGTKTIPIVCDYVGCVAPSTTDEGWILSNITDNMEIQNVHEYYKHLKCLYWTCLPEPPKEVQK